MVGSKWEVVWLAEGYISCESEVEGTQMLWGRYVPTEDLSSTPEVIVKEKHIFIKHQFFKNIEEASLEINAFVAFINVTIT